MRRAGEEHHYSLEDGLPFRGVPPSSVCALNRAVYKQGQGHYPRCVSQHCAFIAGPTQGGNLWIFPPKCHIHFFSDSPEGRNEADGGAAPCLACMHAIRARECCAICWATLATLRGPRWWNVSLVLKRLIEVLQADAGVALLLFGHGGVCSWLAVMDVCPVPAVTPTQTWCFWEATATADLSAWACFAVISICSVWLPALWR